ncbi:MAG: diguanylate cyclase [Candidatus Omnitrophica bacterium]|nr:diguanylate cyclase [Candidatus Omnitrophota bacterium]MDD5553746.1 diguanylate cyclase [Candidatus Omnitrophota bacterium]
MKKEENHSMAQRGIKYKMNLAFYLMTVLPLLVCAYIVSNYVLPLAGLKLDIVITMLITLFIAVVGFFIVKQIIDRILSVNIEAKLILAGDVKREVKVDYKDEIGELGQALNALTQRIRGDMDELKGYGEKSSKIDLQIHKRILILSNLLEISSLISHGDKLDNVLKFTAEKSRVLANSDIAYFFIKEGGSETFYLKAKDGPNSEHLSEMRFTSEDRIFNRLILRNQPLIVDDENPLPRELADGFLENFKLSSTLALPVILKGKLVGILGIGNRAQNIAYKKDDKELLELFTKQIAIAVENDILLQRLKELEIRDPLTGLYNETFIRNRLEEEIKRAIIYRRPCAFILLNIDNFREFQRKFGSLEAEAVLKKTAALILHSFTEVDRTARIADNEFAIVLPEKNKRQAFQTAEEVRKKIEAYFIKEYSSDKRLTASGGVSENPLDGVNAQELFTKAKDALNFAKTQGKNQVSIIAYKI